MEQFWTWAKVDTIDGSGDPISRSNCFTYFEKQVQFYLEKIMCIKKRSTLQDHVNYIHNDIFKPFRVFILQYSKGFREINNLFKYLPPSPMKGEEYDEADWSVRDKQFSENQIHVKTKDRLLKSMQDELEDKDKDYWSIPHE